MSIWEVYILLNFNLWAQWYTVYHRYIKIGPINCLQQASSIWSTFTHDISLADESVLTQRTPPRKSTGCPTLGSCRYYRVAWMWYWDCHIWQVQWTQLVAVPPLIALTFVSLITPQPIRRIFWLWVHYIDSILLYFMVFFAKFKCGFFAWVTYSTMGP